jgi:hypothetical protein
VIKPVFDGVIAAFHQHDGTNDEELSKRLASKLGKDWAEILRHLHDSTIAVLGTRRLLWLRGEGVQWNPGDDGCVAGELLLDESSSSGFFELSGELFEVKEAQQPVQQL